MPTFFRENQLTEDQKANWDKAIEKHKKVFEFNALQELKSMSDKNKKEIMRMGPHPQKEFTDEDVLKKIKELAMIMGNPPGHEKSALFYRLLSGERIMKIAPPTSFSYPDYDIVESNVGREIPMMDSFDVNTLVQDKTKYIPFKHIVINQSAWKVLEVVSPTKIKVTYSRWEKEGFVWELELKDILASETQSAIICNHDPKNGKITTYEALQKEGKYQAIQHFRSIKIAMDKEELKKFEEEQSNKYKNTNDPLGMMSNWSKQMVEQTLKVGQSILAGRLEDGRPPYPTEEEINIYAEEWADIFIGEGKDYYVKDGLLYQKTWMLKRVSPAVMGDEYYISDEEFNALEITE
jgi:hypothetical protein